MTCVRILAALVMSFGLVLLTGQGALAHGWGGGCNGSACPDHAGMVPQPETIERAALPHLASAQLSSFVTVGAESADTTPPPMSGDHAGCNHFVCHGGALAPVHSFGFWVADSQMLQPAELRALSDRVMADSLDRPPNL